MTNMRRLGPVLLLATAMAPAGLADDPALREQVPAEVRPDPDQRRVVLGLAPLVHLCEVRYGDRGEVVHLGLSNHEIHRASHRLEAGRPGVSDLEFRELGRLPALRSLWVEKQPLTDNAFDILASLPELEAFLLDDHRDRGQGGATPEFVRHLDGLQDLKALRLKHLFGLDGTEVDRLEGFPKLEKLELDNHSAGPEALELLARCPGVRDLELHRTSLSNEQIGRVVDLLQGLERIVIKPSARGSDHRCLLHLGRLEGLREVGLHQWKVGSLPFEDGLEHLAEIASLQFVDFAGSAVRASDPAVQRLQEARPDLRFLRLND